MSLLRRRGRAEGSERAVDMTGWIAQWLTAAGGTSVTPTSVQAIDTALKSSVVWRCATKNASTIASFPVRCMSGSKRMATLPQLVADPVADGGETKQPSFVFTSFFSMYLRGGANWLISTKEGSTRPARLTVIHPDRVDWSTRDGWLLDGKPVEHWPLGPLMHVPMFPMAGSPMGLNPLRFMARSLFPGMAAQEFSANFFRDGAHPTAIIAPESDPGPEGAAEIKRRVVDATSGRNREPLVMPQSVKYEAIQIDPKDSQFIEAMRLSDEQVCRFMGTPPEEVGITPVGGSGTLRYGNREQWKQDYLEELQFPMKQLTAAWSSLLPRPQSVELDPAGLLRTDLQARYESYRIASEINEKTGKTFLSVEEMRALEGRDPIVKTEGASDG